MTPKDLDALIRKIIIPQTKPISTGNSYFRRMGDKRRWGKLIRSERLKNPARYFYNHLLNQSKSWFVGDYGYIFLLLWAVWNLRRNQWGHQIQLNDGQIEALCKLFSSTESQD